MVLNVGRVDGRGLQSAARRQGWMQQEDGAIAGGHQQNGGVVLGGQRLDSSHTWDADLQADLGYLLFMSKTGEYPID